MSHDGHIVDQDRTFILTGYTIRCSEIVVAWEFCYQISGAQSITFSPGIWKSTKTSGSSNTIYELVQSNTVTFDAHGTPYDIHRCRIFNLSDADQYTAPEGSVVGLYSNVVTQLLHTNRHNSTTTFRFSGNQTRVRNVDSMANVNYNIAIRVHLGIVKVYNICK